MKSAWNRKGLIYSVKVRWYDANMNYYHECTRKLTFVAYHLIKLYHGPNKLKEMAEESPEYRLRVRGIDYSNPFIMRLRNEKE